MKKLSFTLLLLSLFVLPAAVNAVRLDHLYEAEVDAAGRDTASRDAALAQALAEVLARLTGSRAALQDPAAAALLEKPGRFAEQFRYVETPADDRQPAGLRLWVQFDGVSLARELRQAGLPYWGPERPGVLVWLAIDDRGRRYLVSEDGDDQLGATLQQSGRQHGLPLSLPLMDLQDQRAVEFTDVWGQFAGRVEAASQRYRPQAILTVRLERRSATGQWRGDWQLADAGTLQTWSTRDDRLSAALDSGIAQAAEWLARRYAVVAAAAGARTLVVEDVRNLDDYARVSGYLASLSPVDRVDVLRVEQHTVEFNLELSADERNLLQLIALGRVLRRVDDPAAWRFRLQP